MHYIWPLYIMSNVSLNVFRQPLKLFSTQPMTGFHRDGYCRTSALDSGNHAVAGVVSEDFLDYTARQGNDLRPVGLSEGCKWCLCTGRWLQALRAFESGSIPQSAVPKVDLEATEESALRSVDLETLRAFAVESQRGRQAGGQQTNGVNGVNGVNGH
ncbi:hypothetical protein KVR01_007528 [Diaporthe batatas]|uniref:uncharacterized protein n=1 Tax=Diaporthe batatas TaxID=748121 RepID=UPI001D049BE6|nr:uncharacterized protein KVR01_007528 [Diaporthe batatas]KAG8163050.1 hypothetical protein KVR01_007528 [Diaporthe batatas]